MSILIICLPSGLSPSDNYDYARTPDGRTVAEHASAPLALLPVVPKGTELVAVVPAGELSWHAVELPKGIGAGSPRLRAILENLLEDRLLDDPAQLHLALAPAPSSGGITWVAACNKAWLRGHLQALESAGRPVARIVPEFAPEDGPLQVYLTGEPDLAFMVATGTAVAGVLRVPFSAAALGLLPAPEAGDNVLLAAEPAVAALAEELLQAPVSLMTPSERWLDAARASWDLAQFDLSSSGRARTVKRLSGVGRDLLQSPGLRPARWGLAVLVLAHVAGLNAWAWKEQSSLQSRRSAIQSALTQTFPQIRVVVDAPLQMEREVAALRQATGAASGRDLEAMLSALGTVTPPDRSLAAIEFSAGEAKLRGLQSGGQDAASLPEKMAALGYNARLEGDIAIVRQDNAKAGVP